MTQSVPNCLQSQQWAAAPQRKPADRLASTEQLKELVEPVAR